MKENRKAALAILVACVLLSVFGLGGLKLNGERRKTLDLYERGAMDDGLSVRSDLTRRGDDGVKLAAIGEVYLGSDDDEVTALRDAAESINRTDDVNERLRLSRLLSGAQASVYARLVDAGMNETDARDARLLDRNITSAYDTIANDPYFEKAAAFNKVRSRFPASLIAAVTGIGALTAQE